MPNDGIDPGFPWPVAAAGQPAPAIAPADDGKAHVWAQKGFQFHDLLDIVNPLQHLPVVSSIYRWITGDGIGNLPRVVGDALYGGPIGFVSGLLGVLVKEESGKDIGEHMIATLTGGSDSPATGSAQAAAPADPDGRCRRQPRGNRRPGVDRLRRRPARRPRSVGDGCALSSRCRDCDSARGACRGARAGIAGAPRSSADPPGAHDRERHRSVADADIHRRRERSGRHLPQRGRAAGAPAAAAAGDRERPRAELDAGPAADSRRRPQRRSADPHDQGRWPRRRHRPPRRQRPRR